MAGNDDLNMDLLDLGDITIPEQEESTATVEEETPVTNITNIADDKSQEIVGKSTEESTSEEEESGQAPAESVFKPLVEFLKEEGILSVQYTDEDVKDENTFAELIRKQTKENEYSSLNDNQKTYLSALEKGIPDEVIHEYLTSKDAYDKITDEYIKSNPEIRKELIVQGLKTKGFDDAYALAQYNRVSNSGEDIAEAITFRDMLKQSKEDWYKTQEQQAIESKKQAEEAAAKQLEDLKSSVYSREKVLETIPVSKGIQDKVYATMTKPVAYTEDGRPLNALMKYRQENPVEFETNLYYLFELTNGFKDLKTITNKAASRAVNSLKAKLAKTNFIQSSTGNPNIDNTEVPIITEILD